MDHVHARWYQVDGTILEYRVDDSVQRSKSADKDPSVESTNVWVEFDPEWRREVIKAKYKVKIPYQWGDYEARYDYPEFTIWR